VKPVLAWVKKNLLVVICSAVVLLVIPAAFFVSSAWGTKIRTEQEKAATQALNKLKSAGTAALKVEVPFPDAAPIEVSGPPNSKLISHLKVISDQVQAQVSAVTKDGEAFNKGAGPLAKAVGRDEHTPFVEGLFPGPDPVVIENDLKQQQGEQVWTALPEDRRLQAIEQRRRDMQAPKMREMEDALLAKNSKPNRYQALLDRVKAGTPPDVAAVAQMLQVQSEKEQERIAGGKRQLTPEEGQRLRESLSEYRLGLYQQRARTFSVYASMAGLPVASEGWRGIPTEALVKAKPSLVNDSEFFVWQWDYWVLSDVFSAVALVNRDKEGRPTDVERSVVKRISRISLEQPKGYVPADAPANDAPTDPNAAAGGGTPPMPVPPLDPAVSITGRTSSPANGSYDVRVVDLEIVVSSARLPEFLSAISRTNFMTVIGLRLDDVNVYQDLAQGYSYGPEHVVRATLKIETVWLRAWLAPLMPPVVKKGFGVATDPAAAGGASPGSEAPPPPPPPG
jgi:hypothetical protein